MQGRSNKVTQLVDGKKAVDVTSLDFSKAYETISTTFSREFGFL